MVEETETVRLEEKERTLYCRMPKTIKDDKEVLNLFPGSVQVKLPRQKLRACHVIFPTVEEKVNCFKKMNKKLIQGKKIFLKPLSEKCLDRENKALTKMKKKAQKKIHVAKAPMGFPQKPRSKHLHVGNIPDGVTSTEILELFPGSVSLSFLKRKAGKERAAILNMESLEMAQDYLKKKLPTPKIKDKILRIHSRSKKKKSERIRRRSKAKEIESDNSDSEAED